MKSFTTGNWRCCDLLLLTLTPLLAATTLTTISGCGDSSTSPDTTVQRFEPADPEVPVADTATAQQPTPATEPARQAPVPDAAPPPSVAAPQIADSAGPPPRGTDPVAGDPTGSQPTAQRPAPPGALPDASEPPDILFPKNI